MCLMKRHKVLNGNIEVNRAPSQTKINEITGNVENSSYKSFNIKPNFVRLTVGVRNFKYFLFKK